MASIGHGISDAVRNHIPIWIDDSLVDNLYHEYKKSGGVLNKDGGKGFSTRIRTSAEWVRKSRKTTTEGYERLYHCKTVQKASLIVHSPPKDDSAVGYVFLIDNKPIAGGRTKLKSTHITKNLSKGDKTTCNSVEAQFVKFTEDELQRMRIQMEFGDGYDFLEVTREV